MNKKFRHLMEVALMYVAIGAAGLWTLGQVEGG